MVMDMAKQLTTTEAKITTSANELKKKLENMKLKLDENDNWELYKEVSGNYTEQKDLSALFQTLSENAGDKLTGQNASHELSNDDIKPIRDRLVSALEELKMVLNICRNKTFVCTTQFV